ncbi:hypothetical protein ES708_25705 [subsurface metagenome]
MTKSSAPISLNKKSFGVIYLAIVGSLNSISKNSFGTIFVDNGIIGGSHGLLWTTPFIASMNSSASASVISAIVFLPVIAFATLLYLISDIFPDGVVVINFESLAIMCAFAFCSFVAIGTAGSLTSTFGIFSLTTSSLTFLGLTGSLGIVFKVSIMVS